MRIGIDFDRVLFDTESFKRMLSEEIPGFEETYQEAKKNYGYSHERHAKILGEDVEKFENQIENADRFLFDDVEKLDELDHEIVIVSRGDPDHQRKKIRQSGVGEFVDEVRIVEGNPENNPKDSVDIDLLVDDEKYELEAVEVPSFYFDREEDSVEDIIQKVKQLDGQ